MCLCCFSLVRFFSLSDLQDRFLEACKKDDLDKVESIIQGQPQTVAQALLQARDENQRSCLHCAAWNGHLAVVQYLVEQGADKEAKDNAGDTALHLAAYAGELAVVQYLVEQGADKEAKNKQGNKPLDDARSQHQSAVVSYLEAVTYLMGELEVRQTKQTQTDR